MVRAKLSSEILRVRNWHQGSSCCEGFSVCFLVFFKKGPNLGRHTIQQNNQEVLINQAKLLILASSTKSFPFWNFDLRRQPPSISLKVMLGSLSAVRLKALCLDSDMQLRAAKREMATWWFMVHNYLRTLDLNYQI